MQSPPQRKPRQANPTVFLSLFVAVGLITLGIATKNFLSGHSKDSGVMLMGGLMFTIMPLLMMKLFKNQQQKAAVAQEQHRHDPAPWSHRADWARGEIAGIENKMAGGMFIGAVIGVFFAAFAFNTFFGGAHFKGAGNFFHLIGALFFIMPILLLVLGIRALRRKKKFGESIFKMSSVPGIIGGKLEGKIEIGARINPLEGFKLRLCCLNITPGSDNKSNTRQLWQTEQHVRYASSADDPTHSAIPVSFQIPSDCEECDQSNPNSRVSWMLEARASVPGVDYFARFEVPVFKPRLAVNAAAS